MGRRSYGDKNAVARSDARGAHSSSLLQRSSWSGRSVPYRRCTDPAEAASPAVGDQHGGGQADTSISAVKLVSLSSDRTRAVGCVSRSRYALAANARIRSPALLTYGTAEKSSSTGVGLSWITTTSRQGWVRALRSPRKDRTASCVRVSSSATLSATFR